ncbi:bacteriorhodopsin [Metabacillus iocasae]|uniref:Bacteriorhodopsin n=1 Tax=Priestia iocasae TaxID=2291674 RepID=A0ABS2QRU6_9BACI|nr:bacteriorhodopsin [Metabacillus iocasae]
MYPVEVQLLWLYVSIMFLGAIVFFFMSRNRKGVPRVEYMIAIIIPVWSGLAYLSMALGQGVLQLNGSIIYFARYIDWVVTTPLLLVALSLTAMFYSKQKDFIMIGTLVVADIIMVLSGLLGDLSSGPAVYTWYLVGLSAFLVILYIIWYPLRQIAQSQSSQLHTTYTIMAGYLTAFWVSYPTVWLLGPSGLGVIGQIADTMFFVLLPIFSKVGFSLLDLIRLRKINELKGTDIKDRTPL